MQLIYAFVYGCSHFHGGKYDLQRTRYYYSGNEQALGSDRYLKIAFRKRSAQEYIVAMITPLEIDHTTLQVSDLKKTKVHLQAIFNFQFHTDPKSENMLAVESENVHFFIQKSDLQKSFLEKQHISFEIKNLDEIKEKLKEIGIEYESGTFSAFKYKNYHWVEWRDHDGIRLECVQKI
ncbi:MAG: VOC family protein [Patescibacteria group bacterium]